MKSPRNRFEVRRNRCKIDLRSLCSHIAIEAQSSALAAQSLRNCYAIKVQLLRNRSAIGAQLQRHCYAIAMKSHRNHFAIKSQSLRNRSAI
jgi:hypothetical protein